MSCRSKPCARASLAAALLLATCSVAAAPAYEFPSAAAVSRASDLKGRIVETRDGEELGRVHDFALDLPNGRIGYVVVSVGSFLIEDSLIAVAPEALRSSADADGRLVLETDAASLRDAQRFSAGHWPRQADVLATAGSEPEVDHAPAGDAAHAPTGRRGTATISDGNKTATLSAGERSIRFNEPPRQADPAATGDKHTADRSGPRTRFERLDRNGDGTLDRAEIAHEMGRDQTFAEIDTNANGAIDPQEFEALERRRAPAGD